MPMLFIFDHLMLWQDSALNIYCLLPPLHHTESSHGGFCFINVGLQPLVFLCPYQRWVIIHMLVRDGRRSPDACWPVREMWQRLVCRDKLESVAYSSQSLQGLAETPTGSCLHFLSFISFSFSCSIFHLPWISRSLPYFVAFPFPSFSFVILLLCHPCQHLSPLRTFYAYTWNLSNNSSSCLFCCCVSIRPNPMDGSACSTIAHRD